MTSTGYDPARRKRVDLLVGVRALATNVAGANSDQDRNRYNREHFPHETMLCARHRQRNGFRLMPA